MAKLLGVNIPGLLNSNMGRLLYEGTLTKRTPGARDPNDPTAGTSPSETPYTFRGFAGELRSLIGRAPLVREAEAAIFIIAESGTMRGIEPKPNDKIQLTGDPHIGSKVATIVARGVSRDPAGASWICQVKL